MSDESRPSSNTSTGTAGAEAQEKAAAQSQELVAKVADRVYAMLMREMKIERERGRYWVESNRGEY